MCIESYVDQIVLVYSNIRSYWLSLLQYHFTFHLKSIHWDLGTVDGVRTRHRRLNCRFVYSALYSYVLLGRGTSFVLLCPNLSVASICRTKQNVLSSIDTPVSWLTTTCTVVRIHAFFIHISKQLASYVGWWHTWVNVIILWVCV